MYSLASINVGVYMLGEIESTIDRESLCRRILNLIHINDVNIICTQEYVLIESSHSTCSEFKSIYESYGYTLVTQDILDTCKSRTVQSKYPSKRVYIGNVIYVRSNLISKVQVLLTKPSRAPACMAQIRFDNIEIANVHLCGGRFDDIKVFTKANFFRSKVDSIKSINHSIICGDFNATRNLGEPGGLRNFKYPLQLCKQTGCNIDSSIIHLWNTWQFSPINFFYDNNYKSCFNDDQLDIISETSSRGHYVVDWVFYDSTKVNKRDSHCEPMYNDTRMLSDHHMLMFTFSTSINAENRGKSYYV